MVSVRLQVAQRGSYFQLLCFVRIAIELVDIHATFLEVVISLGGPSVGFAEGAGSSIVPSFELWASGEEVTVLLVALFGSFCAGAA